MSIQRDDIHTHVARILRDEAGLLVQLEAILADETRVLSGNDADAIHGIGARRQHCVEALTRLEAERGQISQLLSFGSGTGGFERVLEWCDSANVLHGLWRANLDIARRCKDHNDRNGAIVTAQLGRVRRMLATVRGAPPTPVYNARGSRHSALGNRDFGSA